MTARSLALSKAAAAPGAFGQHPVSRAIRPDGPPPRVEHAVGRPRGRVALAHDRATR